MFLLNPFSQNSGSPKEEEEKKLLEPEGMEDPRRTRPSASAKEAS